jgi:hypothetical protein
MEQVSKALERQSEPLSQNAIEKLKLGKAEYVRMAVKCLYDEGFTQKDSRGRYSSVRPFREDEHDTAA